MHILEGPSGSRHGTAGQRSPSLRRKGIADPTAVRTSGRQFRALLRAQQPSDTVQMRQVGHKFIGTDFGDFDKLAVDNVLRP